MTRNNSILNEVAAVSLHSGGQVCLTFFDPAYCRSDLIIFDRTDSSLHAVLHEAAHCVGHVARDMVPVVLKQQDIVLSAPHYSGGNLNLRTKLSIV